MNRLVCQAIMLLALLCSPLHAAPTLPAQTIKVGIFPFAPINSLDDQGVAQGFFPDLLRQIATQHGLTIDFIAGSWADGLEQLQSGEIDLLMSVAYSAKRAKSMDYTKESALELWGQAFIRPGSGFENIDDLDNLPVAIMHQDISGLNFAKTVQRFNINCQFLEFPTFAEAFSAVQNGQAAAAIAPQHYGIRHAANYELVPSSIQFSPFSIFFTAKKGHQQALLSLIDSTLSRWKQDKNSYYYQRLNYWMTGQRFQDKVIPQWLLFSLAGVAAAALLLLFLSLLFKAQVRRRTSQLLTANTSLRCSEARYRNLIESMIQPLALHEIICDENDQPIDYRYLDINPAFAQLLGKTADEIIGRRVLELLPETEPGWIAAFGEVALSGEANHFENYTKAFNKYFDVVAYSPAPRQFAIVATDITARVRVQQEQKRLEDQLLHAQKLESLGVLAGGIAHDFNNILMAVLGHCELALRRLGKESPAVQNIEQIKKSASKAADLANQMLAYSGRGKFTIEPHDLSEIADEMRQMLAVSISKKALLRYEFAPLLPNVDVDATQLRQVILNLVINASDAIGDKSGVIAITTGVIDCDQAYLKDSWLDENLPAGQYVFFEVADTGCGMDKATVDRIFEPFFSTKTTGRGLGMAAVLGIIRSHKGAIKIYSEKGQGTTFKVLLPASRKSSPRFAQDQVAGPLFGNGTVLLVDDDETVLSIGREMLEEFGFAVVTAGDGREALSTYQQQRDAIRFVLMDLTMPHMDGEQAFRELRRIDPAVKVIISSGYNQQEVAQKFAGKGTCGFLKKPYQLSALQSAIEKLSPG